jgi:hypothetical protein
VTLTRTVLASSPGAVGGSDIERRTHEGYIVLSYLAHVLQVRRLEERVDAGPVRQLAALEATDLGLVLNRVDTLETELLSAATTLVSITTLIICGNAYLLS